MSLRAMSRWKKIALSAAALAMPLGLAIASGSGRVANEEARSIKGGIAIRCNMNAVANPGCTGATCPQTNYTAGLLVGSAAITGAVSCGTCAGTYSGFTQNCLFP
jgi:hypothetical protein